LKANFGEGQTGELGMSREKLIICRCEEITKEEIGSAIKLGARTMRDVRLITRAGMGLCQGRTCEPLVRRILAQDTGKRHGELFPATRRPPIRPIELKALQEDRVDEVS
jgi:NAD(P)H-nitrite reductase large subunit